MDSTDTSPSPAAPVRLRAFLDGRPVDYATLLAAVWDGAICDFDRVHVELDRRSYLSCEGLPVPEELWGYAPASSESVRNGCAS